MANRTKLAVILHADVAGSTALVRQDERVAHDRIRAAYESFADTVRQYGGVVHEIRGDALLAEFARASDAVVAALAAQRGNAERNLALSDGIVPELRVGIALGEVVIANGTLTGAGVVLAQRLEQLATRGGVCVSAAVREAVPDRLPLDFAGTAIHTPKGFDEPTTAFTVTLKAGQTMPQPEPPADPVRRRFRARWGIATGLALLAIAAIGWLSSATLSRPDVDRADATRLAHPLPALPSVAVLPFANDSGGAGQDDFADGVTQDIITDLSKVSGLFVIARGATLAYRDPAVPARRVAEELGVRFVLQGSVRKSGDQVRITARLVDALLGVQVWADRFDRGLSDVFAVQSEVASHVVKAMAVTLKSGEHERLFQKYTSSIDAYETFIRARRTVDVPSRENIAEGERLFQRVIELDPTFAGGYAGLSFNYSVKSRFGYGMSRAADAARSLELAQKAIRVDPRFGWSYVALAGAQLASGNAKEAAETMRQALDLLPGDYEVRLFAGLYLQFAGEASEAIEHLRLARRMNPVDTDRNTAFLGMAYFMDQDYPQAEAFWRRRNDKFPAGSPMPYVFLAASYAKQGKDVEARATADELLAAYPGFRLDGWGWAQSYWLPEYRRSLLDGARRAGIP
jgi:adenylate cyclase